MLNRGAMILKYREPAIRWINETDPIKDSREVTPELLTQDLRVYLVPDDAVATDLEVRKWIEANFEWLFEAELESWYTDPSLWPRERTLELFRQWFDVECHSMVIDTVDGVLLNEDV